LGISVWEERVLFATSSIRGTPGRLKDRERSGPSDKNNKNENSENGTQIFHWEVSTGKTGLPFQQLRLFRKIFSGTNQKVVFHLHPNRKFRNFLVNGKRPSFHPFIIVSDPKSRNDGTAEWRNQGITERRKMTPNPKRRNRGMVERRKITTKTKRWNRGTAE